jgi:polyphosphate kinase 2 (PPK2 family)
MSRSLYIKRIKELQLLLTSKQQKLLEEEKSLIILYEGWDASGKGGNIERVVKRLDPTLYKVVPISAPTEEEKKYHYMKMFWEYIPQYGKTTIFDRPWYGRVLVEKVEMLTEPWKIEKAYDEVNMLEEFLMEDRCILIKIFINISKYEQLKRFNKRMNNPFKSYKITNEDWRNRGKWEQDEKTINTCINRTSKSYNTWIIIDGNSKYNARIKCLEHICEILKENL